MEQSNKELLSNEVKWISSQSQNKIVLPIKKENTGESISFWNEAPLFQSSIDSINDFEPINKFLIEKIEIVSSKKKILYGNKQIAIVEGIFSETEFFVGQRVTVLPCLCCIKNINFEEALNCIQNDISHETINTSINDINIIDTPCKTNSKKYKSALPKSIKNADPIVTFHINDETNTILIEDDVLTVTSFCTAQECVNNPLIKSLIADFSFEYAHPSLVIGIIIHELIQSSFINNKSSFEFLTSEAKRFIKENFVLLYSSNISDKEALNEILKNMKNIIKLINGNFHIQAVEHKVYSPFLGLKGSIDCLDSKYVIEIKTGKHMSNQHRSQVILYSILTMEQNLKKSLNDYEQFLCDVSILKEDLSTCSINNKDLETKNTLNEILDSRYEILNPLLYYVKTGDFVKININHDEILHLLKTRNDIACNKNISSCDCPDNFICSILNKIKSLNPEHFLKKLYDDIELESNREKKYLRAFKISQDKHRVVYKAKDLIPIGEYCYIYSPHLKFLAIGIVENCEIDKITIELCDQIETDKVVMICADNDNNSLKFMRWSLVNVAYLKYLKKDVLGKGIDSFLLPGQKYGLDVEEMVDCSCISLDDVELEDLDFDSSFSVNEKQQNVLDVNSNIKNNMMISKEVKEIDCSVLNMENTKLSIRRSCLKMYDGEQHFTNKNREEFDQNSQPSDFSDSSNFLFSAIFSDDQKTNLPEIKDDRKDFDSIGSECSHESAIFESNFSDDNIFSSQKNSSKPENHCNLPNATKNLTQMKSIDSKACAPDHVVRLKQDSLSYNLIQESNEIASHSSQHTVLSSEITKPKVLFNNLESNDSFPYFTSSLKTSFSNFKYCIPDIFKNEFLKLNEEQQQALFSALNCENYRIIHGMPGTGKSTLIALLIRILIFYGQKVLLVCYTHLSIQNILNKVGSVNYYRAKKQNLNFETYEEAVKTLTKPDLVAGTCYSFNDPVYINKMFDYCIIDEGSQIHLLLSLIPLQISKRFCIVGDHLQLKPLCKKATHLSLSLFEYLIDKCSILTHQYRMGDQIMKLSNSMFYNNKLVGFGGHSTVNFVDSENINFTDFIKQLKTPVVLCFFNSKVREVQSLNKDLIVTTIDRFQGSEADEVIVIFDPVEKCNVIESRERLNVALTRARKKLILLGNKREMLKIELFNTLLNLI